MSTTPSTLNFLSLLSPIDTVVSHLRTLEPRPLLITRPLGWLCRPHKFSSNTLGAEDKHWDLIVVFPNTGPVPDTLNPHLKDTWSIVFTPTTENVISFPKHNAELISQSGNNPAVSESKPVTEEDFKANADLELNISPDLDKQMLSIVHGDEGARPVTMVNLLAFVPGNQERYMQYVQEFARTFGPRFGPAGKLFGPVSENEADDDKKRWEFAAMVHYPSLLHFREMVLDELYRQVDRKLKKGSVEDNPLMPCIDYKI
jgi:hypothetical protein